MKQEFIIDRFEGDKAVLKTKSNETVVWPKKLLPKDADEGADLFFTISDKKEEEEDKRELAKNILNEILDVNKTL